MGLFIVLILSLLLLNILLLIYLLIRKQAQQQLSEEKQRVEVVLNKELDLFAKGEIPRIRRHFKRDELFFEILEERVGQYKQLIADEDIVERLNVLTSLELAENYRQKLKARSWSTRMNTLYFIEDFKLAELKDDIWTAFTEQNSQRDETYQMARTLATLQDTRLLKKLTASSGEWPDFLLKECFRRYKDDLILEQLMEIDHFTEIVQIALLDVVTESITISAQPIFINLLESPSLELRVRGLKALVYFDQLPEDQFYIHFHESGEWVERMLFAKIVSRHRKQRFTEILIKLLSDSNWWVRQSAAEALVNFPDGLLMLEHVYKKNEDAFARDIAYQWLGQEVGDQ
ncbi:HEAT repeat domain-containing protein [Bacillus suaedae]|uniref:HEAT repeat domain-containing protein n=1 Tax=Halalkalibacter suaedae TaxID=2822140 RepID=A0A940WV87_9BACI|nr:HEAT repeat domain-containing protein [Bacillus suaedae]MBP3951112.1 HEAT repeat domain-containing protein [Bacillus suaedae]